MAALWTLSHFLRLRHLLCVSSGVSWSIRDAAVPKAPAARPAVEVLFRAHAQELGRYLVAMVRDRSLAEDLLQDTFHDALRAWDRLEGIGNERAWLYGIARHRPLHALRRGRRFQRALVRLAGSREVVQEPDETLVALLDLLERELSSELRALVLLRYVHGLQAAELAEMTGLSPDAVRQRLARGRARLLAAEPKEADR
jgi:RNA polymerase sigma-70 factor (ECF subfamily)